MLFTHKIYFQVKSNKKPNYFKNIVSSINEMQSINHIVHEEEER